MNPKSVITRTIFFIVLQLFTIAYVIGMRLLGNVCYVCYTLRFMPMYLDKYY